MEGASQGGLLAQIVGRLIQSGDSQQTVLGHLARLLQEDLAHFGVFVGLFGFRRRHRHLWRERLGNDRSPVGRRRFHHRLGRHGRSFGCHLDRLRDRLARRHRHGLFPTHQRPEFAGHLVIDKQLFRKRPLITQHVDQEPHRTKAVAQLLKNFRGALLDLVNQEFLDAVAHPPCAK